MIFKSVPNEYQLKLKVSEGDSKAFTILYYHYFDPISNFVLHTTKSITDTQDIVHDLFAKLWINRARIVEIEDLSNYLFIAAKNRSINSLKKSISSYTDIQVLSKTLATSQHQYLNYNNFINVFENAIQLLPEKQKEIFVLNKVEQIELKVISKNLNLPIDKIKKLSSRASRFVRNYLIDRVEY